MIQSVEEMIQQYVAAWNKKSLEEFTTEFSKCWASEATYIDPTVELVKGVDGISGLANQSLEVIPVREFQVKIAPEHHHNVGRYTWQVVLPQETKEGFDYFEFDNEFKITKIASFF